MTNSKPRDFLESAGQSISQWGGYHSTLLKTAKRYLGSIESAEDAVSDFYLRQMTNMEKYDFEINGNTGIENQDSKLPVYLYRPFYWHLKSIYREEKWRKRREEVNAENRLQYNKKGQIEEIVQAEERDKFTKIVHVSLEKLQDYKDLIILKYFNGFSRFKIAKMLGIPAGTVASRLDAARRKLKDILTSYMPEQEYVEFLMER